LVSRRAKCDRIGEEVEEHLALMTADNVRAGMTPADARRAAVLKFGAVEPTKERYRDQRSLPVVEALLHDCRDAVRRLRKSPGFTLVAVVTLALGIGANTALFTIVDQLLLRLLPVKNSHELVAVSTQGSFYGDNWGDGTALSYPLYAALRDNNDVFSGMLARFSWEMQVRVQDRVDRVLVEHVTGSYFPVFGVNADLGRTILPSDDDGRGGAVAVLSHRYWQTALAADPAVIGKTLVANNHPLTIVGVARKGFDGSTLGIASHVFVPIRLVPVLTPVGVVRDRPIFEDPRIRWATVFGRLRSGTGLEQAESQLRPFYASRLASEVREDGFARASETDRTRYLQSSMALTPAGDGRSPLRRQLTQPLWIMTAVVGIVLLIACANLANLLLARAIGRQREFALRLALGATPRRLSRQLLVESVVLSVGGAILGLGLAAWGAGVLLAYVPNPGMSLTISAGPDARILAFTMLVAIGTGILFGLVPAFRSTRPDVAPTLKSEAGTLAGSGFGRLRRAFMVVQVALSVFLLVGAGLFVRSLSNLMQTELGVDADRILSFRIDPDSNGLAGERGKQFVKELRDRLARTPGVTHAAFASQRLLAGNAWSTFIRIDGQPYDPARQSVSFNNAVSSGYFAAMGIPLLQGRDFEARDERVSPEGPSAFVPQVAIANRTFVDRYLDGKSAIGVRVGFGRDPNAPTPIEIVGVVGDSKYTSVRDAIQPQLYFPGLSGPRVGLTTFYVRTDREAASMLGSVQDVVRQFSPAVPLFDAVTVDALVNRSVATDRLIASLTSWFGALATLLAMVGLYGVLAYTVTRRRREIGLRIALGATRPSVAWLVCREAFTVVVAGIALALPAVLALTRLVESQLYGVSALDPISIVGAIFLLTTVAVGASYLPARHAGSVDPLTALRAE
jgi:predicted permease